MADEALKPKGRAIPDFHIESVKNEHRSSQEGRPCYDDREQVRILIPGDRNSSPVEIVNDEHRARWPVEYAAFKAGMDAPIDGTPLNEWPPITRSQVKEFAHFNVFSVQDMAALNDSHIMKMPMGTRALRDQAKTFVEVAEHGTGPIARMVDENLRLRDENDRKDRTIAEMGVRIQEMEAASAKAAA